MRPTPLPRRWPWIAGAVVATVLLWLAVRHASAAGIWSLVRQADPLWSAASVVANAAILLAYAALWRHLAPPVDGAAVPMRTTFEIVAVSSTVMNTTPMLAGHATAVGLLVSRARLQMRQALSVLAMDQGAEGAAKIALVATAVMVAPLPVWLRAAALSAVALAAAFLVVLVAFANRAPQRLAHLARDLAPLRSWRAAGVALALALVMKLLEGLAIVLAQHSLGLDLPLGSVAVVLAATSLATMIPLSPGNVGPYEAAAAAVYMWMDVPPDAAVALAAVQHACFLLPSIGIGWAITVRRSLA
jgi:uncharacterized membrane protein YbhN (UPF0104 family)